MDRLHRESAAGLPGLQHGRTSLEHIVLPGSEVGGTRGFGFLWESAIQLVMGPAYDGPGVRWAWRAMGLACGSPDAGITQGLALAQSECLSSLAWAASKLDSSLDWAERGRAPVAQGIEQWFPKPCAQVRILPGALIDAMVQAIERERYLRNDRLQRGSRFSD